MEIAVGRNEVVDRSAGRQSSAEGELRIMSSSLRERSLEDTLVLAHTLAPELGITRVVDTTWLDRVGIPVFASIRPTAHRRSLAVNAGKGRLPNEAKVGAFMEAIEFAYAESWRHLDQVHTITARQVYDEEAFPHELLALGPILGRAISPEDRIACVVGEEVFTGDRAVVPAELVFNPFPDNPGAALYGTSTNGLASGNTVDEATLHGLCELIERDVTSFQYVNQASWFVNGPLPANVQELIDKIENAGLQVVLRYSENAFGLPYFRSYVLEAADDLPIAISVGIGLHLDASIAAVRAVSEAAQSRLSFIHGGRDDLIDRYTAFDERGGKQAETAATASLRSQVLDRALSVEFGDVPDVMGQAAVHSIPSALDHLRRRLEAIGVTRAYRYELSPTGSPLAVVRVIAPGLEHFKPDFRRVGARLAECLLEGGR